MPKLSDWQSGKPTIDGVYEVIVSNEDGSMEKYYSYFINGVRGPGYKEVTSPTIHRWYNFDTKPYVWRGLIDE